jgi:hypothetical protein
MWDLFLFFSPILSSFPFFIWFPMGDDCLKKGGGVGWGVVCFTKTIPPAPLHRQEGRNKEGQKRERR